MNLVLSRPPFRIKPTVEGFRASHRRGSAESLKSMPADHFAYRLEFLRGNVSRGSIGSRWKGKHS